MRWDEASMKNIDRPTGVCVLLTCLLLLGFSGPAAGKGSGIQAGEGRLHPSIDLDLVYDTNPGFFRDSDSAKVGDLLLRIRPGLEVSFPSETVSFDLSGKVGYDRYFGVSNSATSDLSSVAGQADMRLGFNPNGILSFFVEDVFMRTGDPRYTSLTGKFNRTDNEAKAHFQIKPTGGALMFDLAYGFFIDLFDKTSDMDTAALSSYAHRAYFSGKWKFLPKTAVIIDFDCDLRKYPDSYSNGNKNMDMNAIRATAGMIGQITPTMSLTLKAGYGDTLLSTPQGYTGSDFQSVIGQAELTFQPGTSFIQFGYLRTFQPVVLFAYFGQDRVYARFKQQIAGKFTLSANVGFDWLAYGTAVQQDAGSRTDRFLSADAALDYHIQDWLEVGLSYFVQAVFSSYQQPLAGAGGVEYNKHSFVLHIGVDY
jgi:hypothetical protein